MDHHISQSALPGGDGQQGGMLGSIYLPEEERQFVERAYRSSMAWLVTLGCVSILLIGNGLLA